MKKPFDPSTLRDEVTDPNLTPGRFGAPIDVRAPNVDPEKVVREIKGMLVGSDYLYAEGTLRSILAWIEEHGYVTARQVQAIDHIADAPQRQNPRRDQRRWR